MKKHLFLYTSIVLFSVLFIILASSPHEGLKGKTSKPSKSDYLEHAKKSVFNDDMKMPAEPLYKILWKYSPDAYILVKRYEKMSVEFKVGGYVFLDDEEDIGPAKTVLTYPDGRVEIKITNPGSRGLYRHIDMTKPFINQVEDLPASVHELKHGYTWRNFRYLIHGIVNDYDDLFFNLPGGKGRKQIGYDSFYLDRNTTLYADSRYNRDRSRPVFPSSELSKIIPDHLKIRRYKTYITGNTTTQDCGILGLLDEYNAYYWSNKVIYDLYGYCRDEEPQTVKTWYRWANRLFDMYISWGEFRYYILSYIVYAREHDKDVYRSLIDDTELRAAWTEIDDSFIALIDRIFIRIGKELPAYLKSKGMRVSIEDMKIFGDTDRIKEKGFRINDANQGMNYKYYARLVEEMTKPEYIQAASEFRLRPVAKLPSWPADLKQE